MDLEKIFHKYSVRPGEKVNLSKIDPGKIGLAGLDKESSSESLQALDKKLDELQELLYAQHRHKLLVVLQGMDTAGKDGVIRHVFRGVNPQGVKVTSFKAPTQAELDHDFLWRIHAHVPARGEVAIFNRSHYEDVVIVRVHELIPAKRIDLRYGHINDFERLLADEEVTIAKFFLHIDKEEQKKRLLARQADPTKQWKLSPQDIKERKLWGKYMSAYETMLARTSTDYAPWHIVPSNRKWYRNLFVATTLVRLLKKMKLKYPQRRWKGSEMLRED